MLKLLLKAFSQVGKPVVLTEAELEWNESLRISEAATAIKRRHTHHARRMGQVKDVELNRLRTARFAQHAEQDVEIQGRWQSTTLPQPLDSRQVIAKIDQIERGMDFQYSSRHSNGHWANTLPPQAPTRRETPRHPSLPESPYTASVALVSTGRYCAELILRDLIRPESASAKARDTWECLLGLLRAAGDKASFENAAHEHMRLTGSASTIIFDNAPAGHERADNSPSSARWECPPRLGSTSLRRLKDVLDGGGTPILNWSRCEAVEAGVSAALQELLLQIAESSVADLQDAQPLILALSKQAAPVNAAEVWWLCLLAALRCCNERERYETVALEYCSRYQVSPPPWQASQPVITALKPSPAGNRIVISGELEEMSSAAFDRLIQTNSEDTDAILVCDNLVRLDFYSAAALVNWAAERHALGAPVRLTGIHKLLGLYLQSIGLHDHASVESGPMSVMPDVPGTLC